MSSGTDQRAQEHACPSCGAMVRKGLVRCWNCSAFMKPEIAAAYERMQADQPESGFRPLPEHPTPSGVALSAAPTAGEEEKESGFELDASFTMAQPGAKAKPGQQPATEPAKKEGGPETADAKPADKAAPSADASPSKSPEKADASQKSRETAAAEEASTSEALLQAALQEEKEFGGRRRAGFDPVCVEGGWMITCACPARVRIKIRETHRGKTGKCPNPSCGCYFTVPADLPEPKAQQDDAEAADGGDQGFPADPAEAAGPYTHWLRDVRLHVIKPAKARRKSGGHEKEFQPADLGFSKNAGIAAISLGGKPAFLGKPKKPDELRQAILTELREGKATEELTSEAVFTFEAESLAKLAVEYPPAYEHDSTFVGVPVFGDNYIAVKLPPAGADDEQHFVALTLTQYRRLRELLAGLYEMEEFGVGCPVPDDGDTVSVECHFSGESLSVLRNPVFHIADPEITLEAVAYRCESCGIIVSEESRQEKEIGGKEGKKLAAAKCPQCKGKFGKTALYALERPKDEASEEAATEKPSAEASTEDSPATEGKDEKEAADAASESK